ncbi:hypothetical protein BOX15_Mlig028467g3 [Macrostomum lignano]|uniref:Magnesium transporter protein 1 n=1 Tax=Macrostomum lignano TaxID=282301 RepID=A0A267H3D2_9PLAT|nr:hypothetical protein BOX15_Mlig028467g3 [Macrostomum lignano]
MKFIFYWTFFYLVIGITSADPAKDQVLSQRVQQLIDWSSRKSVIRLNSDKFRQYVRGPPKNYSVIVMLTALSPSRGCQVCKYAHEEFTIVANSWRYAQSWTSSLFFAMVDFDEGSDVFSMLKQNSAPVFIHFPAKGQPKKGDVMDIHRIGFQAEVMARWITERTDIQIRVFRPPNYSWTLVLGILMSMAVGVLYLKRSSLDFIYNKKSWGICTTTIIFAMISGQMWNHIRGPPFLHKHPNSANFMYIYPGADFQFIAETFIIYIMYAAIVGSVVLLNEAHLSSKIDASKRKVIALSGIGIFAIFFSFLLSIFRSKYNGYPYSFMFR